MKTITLTQGKEALVDDDVYEDLNKHRWCFSNGYAMRRKGVKEGSQQVWMHKILSNPDPNDVVLHKDGNKLNNQRENLIATSRRVRQQRMVARAVSGYKGVCKRGSKWVVHIGYRGKTIDIGRFVDKEDAARAYDRAAIEYYGLEAQLNFPRTDYVVGHRMTQEVDNVG